MKLLKKIFKHKLKLPTTTSDNIIFNDLFPFNNNLDAIQVISHLLIYNYILNNPFLDYITQQIIINIQLDTWLPWWPSTQYLISLDQKKYLSFTTFTKALVKFAHMGFTFTPSFDTVIRGGNKAIIEQIPFNRNTLTSWKRHLLLFKDQLVNIDRIYVKEWKDINLNL
ncbi:hypothetical protein C1645_840519 [Glomus cerebriforme]|uniref:Uncharacterized protein n=1 Tax=Glomus cerebriforme TaxID=658196 RepID=A0A397RZ55_9GLOM|nr:hypothetical protein C1645_840519 [Glomus cerebriforme]